MQMLHLYERQRVCNRMRFHRCACEILCAGELPVWAADLRTRILPMLGRNPQVQKLATAPEELMLLPFQPDRRIKARIGREWMHDTRGLGANTQHHRRMINMKNIKHVFAAFTKDESGQDLIEYALVAGLIGLGAVVAMTGLSGKISNAFNAVGNSLTNAIA
jgi:pilus assembly protein Flp/PilA